MLNKLKRFLGLESAKSQVEWMFEKVDPVVIKKAAKKAPAKKAVAKKAPAKKAVAKKAPAKKAVVKKGKSSK
jgi:DNA-binding protein HU-beta